MKRQKITTLLNSFQLNTKYFHRNNYKIITDKTKSGSVNAHINTLLTKVESLYLPCQCFGLSDCLRCIITQGMVDQGIPHLFKNGNKNPKVEKMVGGGGLENHQQNNAALYFHFDIFILENKITGEKMQLDRHFAWFPATVECPVDS
jgi:hypothetical protein